MNIIGIVVSLGYITLLLGIASIIPFKDREHRRNMIHIGVSNWWLIASIFFTNVIYASIVPLLFVVVNYLSYRYGLIHAMERKERDLGTVYYAISCFLLTIVSFGILKDPFYGAIGMLIMGYGDGFANVLGRAIHSKQYQICGNQKSFAGTITMFLISFLVIVILCSISHSFNLWNALLITLTATLLENITTHKMDNLTVPLVSTLLTILLF